METPVECRIDENVSSQKYYWRYFGEEPASNLEQRARDQSMCHPQGSHGLSLGIQRGTLAW